ncbi:NAD(P)-binding protein [Hypoxylon cercidicola]|nr:NAD(P)-binding protein [Hypoxylon cercidicola]
MEAKPYNLPADAVWFITGCSSGIGQTLVHHIATTSPSQRVPLGPRDPRRSQHPEVGAGRHVAGVDVVVNNAGYSPIDDAEASPPGNADARALAVLRDANPETGQVGGVVVNVSSMGGVLGWARRAARTTTRSSSRHSRGSPSPSPRKGAEVGVGDPRLQRRARRGADQVRDDVATTHRAAAPRARGGGLTDAMPAGVHRGPQGAQGVRAPRGRGRGAICGIVGAGKRIPLRVPLGGDAYGLVRQKLEKQMEDLEEYRELGCSMGDSRLDHVTNPVG